MGESSPIATLGKEVPRGVVVSSTHSLMVVGSNYASAKLLGNQFMVPLPSLGTSLTMAHSVASHTQDNSSES